MHRVHVFYKDDHDSWRSYNVAQFDRAPSYMVLHLSNGEKVFIPWGSVIRVHEYPNE